MELIKSESKGLDWLAGGGIRCESECVRTRALTTGGKGADGGGGVDFFTLATVTGGLGVGGTGGGACFGTLIRGFFLKN